MPATSLPPTRLKQLTRRSSNFYLNIGQEPAKTRSPCSERQHFHLRNGDILMSDLVYLSKDNDIAIITINNPPVNALSPGVPEGIAEAIDKVNSDAGVNAAVLIGAGKTFVAGADI